MAVSKPLRGTSRETPSTSLRVDRDAEPAPGVGPLGLGERPKAVDVDARGDDRGRELAAGRAIGLGGRVRAGGDHMAGVAQHVGERLLAARQPPRHGDLGAVQHDVVRQFERRPDQPERHGRIEHDQLGAELAGELVDASHHDRMREQHRFAARARPGTAGRHRTPPRPSTGW